MPDGVVHSVGPLPPVAPGPIASSIKKAVHEALGELPAGAGGAIVRLSHDKGVELAFAHRSQNGRWQVDAFVGKGFQSTDTIRWGAEARMLW